MLNRVMDAMMLWRSFPCIIAYWKVSDAIKRTIDKDLQANCSTCGIYALHSALLHNGIFRRQFYLRIRGGVSKLLYSLARVCYKPAFGLEISTTSGEIGGGLQIRHGYSTIIFCHSAGENLTVYQNVTIGRGKMINGNDVPIIGDNVTIYTGAIVIGGIKIGNNVKIGAGAVVVQDVPDNATVVGQKARILLHE